MTKTGITVVLGPEGKVLIQRRTETAPWMPGWWDLPGGAANEGEAVEDAARRELWEEAGIATHGPFGPLGKVSETAEVYAFVVRPSIRPMTRLQPNEEGILEHDQHVWVGTGELDTYQIVGPALEAIRRAVQC